jgi:hypothetical protein
MKKMMIISALMACAAVVTAETVTSANIVGYSKADLSEGGLQILSTPFSGSEGGVALENSFSGLEYGAKLTVWNGSAYVSYTYYGDYGWYDSANQPADSVVLNSGTAAWVKDAGAGSTALTSGEVPSTNVVDVAIVAGLNLIANPYPVAFQLQDVPAGISYGDKITLWTGSSYASYTYYGDYGWYDSANQAAPAVEIGVGKGFWLNAKVAGTLSFDKAY